MQDILNRIWENLAGRIGGPLTFRFIFQPIMASILAIRAGAKDARVGRSPYFWSLLSDPAHRGDLIRQGWKDVGKVVVLAIILDVIYQIAVLHWVYPGELLIVGVILAIVPYLFMRGLVTRIVRGRGRGTNPPKANDCD